MASLPAVPWKDLARKTSAKPSNSMGPQLEGPQLNLFFAQSLEPSIITNGNQAYQRGEVAVSIKANPAESRSIDVNKSLLT